MEEDELVEAMSIFNKVQKSFDDSYLRANTNIGNILDYYGRNSEAIFYYDKVLAVDPNFGMVLGNKAEAIFYYYNLLAEKKKQTEMLFLSRDLFESALDDDRIENQGNKIAVSIFESRLNHLNNIIKSNNLKRNNTKQVKDKYKNFIFEKNLFLNYHFGLNICKDCSFKDDIFPPLISNLKEDRKNDNNVYGERIGYSIKLFNQIIEDFVSARYLYYIVNSIEDKYNQITKYISTLDYNHNSINYGVLKTAFVKLYNVLDKIANFIFVYFQIEKNEDIYFSSLTKSNFKKIIQNIGNRQLLALHSLSRDFQDGNIYSSLKNLRNKMVHEFIDIKEMDIETGYDKRYDSYHISPCELNDNLELLFYIIKSAIIYLSLSLEWESKEVMSKNPVGNLYMWTQKDIFGEK